MNYLIILLAIWVNVNPKLTSKDMPKFVYFIYTEAFAYGAICVVIRIAVIFIVCIYVSRLDLLLAQ